ncbi:hypothetical protein JQX09_24425 [Sulfitobacter pseudonitzschiae]|nr:hypothetical protein [Pseudosulfitobacter pseudonitzschiae]MBM2319588.1 hypothetical protein [Pseudosulfitobacter pseudonitzschiae]
MTLKHRLSALEKAQADPLTVFASVPLGWSPEHAEREVKTCALSLGIQSPFSTCIIHKKDVEQVSIDGVESMKVLLEYVALHGRRLGQKGSGTHDLSI